MTTRVGRTGTVALAAELRRRFGLEEGVPVVTEAREDGILVKPVAPSSDPDQHRRLIEETNRAYAALREDAAA